MIDIKKLKTDNWLDIFNDISNEDILQPLNDILKVFVFMCCIENPKINLNIINNNEIFNMLLFCRGTINDLLKNFNPVEIYTIIKNSDIKIDNSRNYVFLNEKIISINEYKKDIMILINDIKYNIYNISKIKNISIDEIYEMIAIVLNTNYLTK